MDALCQDVRYAARWLLSNRAFALIATVTLTLGIGANSAIFSVVSGVLLKPLPYDRPDQLVRLFQVFEGQRTVVSPPNFLDASHQARTLTGLAAYRLDDFTLTGAGDPVRLAGADVSASFFDLLGVQPILGRSFQPRENQPGETGVVVLGHALWQERLGGDPAIIGRSLTVDGTPRVVVGIMPSGFSFPARRELWMPLLYDQRFTDTSRGAWYLSVIGRLKPEVELSLAAIEMQTIGHQLERQYPAANTGVGLTVVPLHDELVRDVRTPLLLLLGAVLMVLLIACSNVGSLFLARGAAREAEIAVRTALGASRARVVRQLVTESLLLSLLGVGGGLLLALWVTDLLVLLQPRDIPHIEAVTVDGTVVAFTALVGVLASLVFGLIPALHTTRGDPATSLKDGGRSAVVRRDTTRFRGALAVAEIALAVVLLAGAGLLMKSFVRLHRVDPGFRSDHALAFSLALPPSAYDDAGVAAFVERLLQRLEALSSAQSAGATLALPLTGYYNETDFQVEGRAPAPPGQEPNLQLRVVTPGYFRVMGVRLVQGRLLNDADRASSVQVALLNEAAVRRYFPDEDPLMAQITLGWNRRGRRIGGRVVGIVRDTKELGLDHDTPPTIFLAHQQVPASSMDVVLRVAGPPLSLSTTVRDMVRELDPNLPISNMQTLDQIVTSSVARPRFYMMLLGIFAATALLLAAIGIFGLMSWSVEQRTRELGLRIALGADRARLMMMVVGQGMNLAVGGLVLGIAGALALSRTLSSLLFELSPTDPTTFVAAALTLGVVALIATYLPARRATRVDPAEALRAG